MCEAFLLSANLYYTYSVVLPCASLYCYVCSVRSGSIVLSYILDCTVLCCVCSPTLSIRASATPMVPKNEEPVRHVFIAPKKEHSLLEHYKYVFVFQRYGFQREAHSLT